MMSNTRINIRVDEDLKKEAEKIYSEMGMNLTTAINVFLKQSVHDHSIPFQPNLHNPLNKKAREEVENDETEKFDSVEDWWSSMNED